MFADIKWEATYANGQVYRESQGGTYQGIDRSQLREFSLVAPGELLVSLPIRGNGDKFFFRRRTAMTAESNRVIFLLGFVDPLRYYVVDPSVDQVVLMNEFGDAVTRPEAVPGEPFSFDGPVSGLAHEVDAMLIGTSLTLVS